MNIDVPERVLNVEIPVKVILLLQTFHFLLEVWEGFAVVHVTAGVCSGVCVLMGDGLFWVVWKSVFDLGRPYLDHHVLSDLG